MAYACPVLVQLRLVCLCPLDDKSPGARRQLTGDDRPAFDVDRGLVLAIGSVEVRTPTVMGLVVVHPDHDPVERADSWHRRQATCGTRHSPIGRQSPFRCPNPPDRANRTDHIGGAEYPRRLPIHTVSRAHSAHPACGLIRKRFLVRIQDRPSGVSAEGRVDTGVLRLSRSAAQIATVGGGVTSTIVHDDAPEVARSPIAVELGEHALKRATVDSRTSKLAIVTAARLAAPTGRPLEQVDGPGLTLAGCRRQPDGCRQPAVPCAQQA
jgi:hypothetical protein